MKRRIKMISIMIAFAIVLTVIVPFANNPIQASAEMLDGEANNNRESLLGLSELALKNRENTEESLGVSGVETIPPTTSPEDSKNSGNIEETKIAPLGISLAMAPYATIGYAYNFAELKALIEGNNGIDYIKMTADIAITGVITVPSTKPTLTIDGLHEGARKNYVLTENKQSVGGAAVNIYAINAAITNIELKNMEIDGYNYYGTVYAGDRAAFTIKYDNVIYDGPQMTHVANGNVHYKDVIATIRGSSYMDSGGALALKPEAAAAQELAEAHNVTFEGNIVIETSSTGSAIWWAYGTTPNLTFMPGTNARIRSYAKTASAGGYFIYGYPLGTILVGEGANITFVLPSGFVYGAGVTIQNVLIKEDASLNLETTGTNATVGRGIQTKEFTAEPNSSFYLITRAAPLTIIGGGSLNINSPARFMAHSATDVTPVRVTANTTVNIAAQTVNLWDNPHTLNDNITNMPNNMFNKEKARDNVTMTWTQGTTVASGLTHNVVLLEDYYLNMPTAAMVNFFSKRMIAMGKHNLVVKGLDTLTNKVTGTATPNAWLRLEYRTGGNVQYVYAQADANGDFEVFLDYTADAFPKPQVIEHYDYLKAVNTVENLSVLSLEHVPATVSFGTQTIPSSITKMKWPNGTLEPWISVLDTRNVGAKWKLTVGAKPLTGTWNSVTHTLPNALLFVKEGQEIILTETQQLIYQGASAVTAQKFAWDGQNGIFVSVDPGSVKTTSYTSTIKWTLEDTP